MSSFFFLKKENAHRTHIYTGIRVHLLCKHACYSTVCKAYKFLYWVASCHFLVDIFFLYSIRKSTAKIHGSGGTFIFSSHLCICSWRITNNERRRLCLLRNFCTRPYKFRSVLPVAILPRSIRFDWNVHLCV